MEISEIVNQTIATGVPPLELKFRAVRDCDNSKVIAYRSEIAVNSVELGCIMQGEFSKVSDNYEIGIRVSEWGISHALEFIGELAAVGKEIKWVSVACPAAYAEQPDFYDRVKNLLKKYKYTKKVRLCLEFSDGLLFSNADVRKSVLDLKILGVNSLLCCNSSDTCPFFKLTEVPVDDVMLSPKMTATITDRNKPGVIPSLVHYLHDVGVGVIAGGATGAQVRDFARLECQGYSSSEEKSITSEDAFLAEDNG